MNSSGRLAVLKGLDILDSIPEQGYDDVVKLAAHISGCPVALVSFLDNQREWFKAKLGTGLSETNVHIALSQEVLKSGKPVIVTDLTLDERFKNHPLVVNAPRMRSYAGFPILAREGYVVGSLLVIDFVPRDLSETQREALAALSRQVASFVELRRKTIELKVRERELSEERAKLSQILSHLRDTVWLRDYETKEILYINDAYDTIWERSRETLLQNPYSFIENIHEDDRARVLAAVENQSKGGYEQTYRIYTPCGKIKWIFARAFVVKDENEKVIYIIGVASDITQKIEQEKLLEEQKGKVLQSARLASLGEMASGIAHEINTPLAVIRGTAQLLDRALSISAPESPIFNQHLATIEKTVVRIAKIISGLRSCARDGSRDEFTSTTLKEIVQDAVELCQHRIRNKGIEFSVELPEHEVRMECRPVQIVQVLSNLLNNSYDAVADQPTKWIKLKVSEDAESVLIAVNDSGPEIPAEIRQKLMQPFFTTKEPGKGMGLGLSLSRGIADSHDGELRLSGESKSTLFELHLPKKHSLKSTNAA